MKPPPRTRTKSRKLKPESLPQSSGQLVREWQRTEQVKLLNGLKRLSLTAGGNGDIDYAFLRKYVPTRSTSEIHSVVESLKSKVISCASLKLRQTRCEEKKVRKPIEVWTHMASAVAGNLEEPISAAFSQMFLVSSTEPCTLRNCDPPQMHKPPADKDRPVGRTVPFRPMPCLPVQGEHPGTNTTRPPQVVKTPEPTMHPVFQVPNSKIPPPQQQLSTTAGISSAASSTFQPAVTSCQPGAAEILDAPFTSPQPPSQTVPPVTGHVRPSPSSAPVVGNAVIQTTHQPSEQHLTTTSPSKSTSPSPHAPSFCSATSLTPVPNTTPSSVASSSSATCSSSRSEPPLSTPAASFHARFGRTSKYATKDSPRMFGVKCVVDFERIYRYLSVIHKPNEECHLTPMESAIVLDLLMSLPEELPLLDCNKLHKHLIQVYQCLSSPADSKIAREMFKDLKNGLGAQTEAPSGRDGNRANSQQNTDRTADSSDVTDSERKKLQPDEADRQSLKNSSTSSHSGDTEVTGLCPPLNPFMMPLKLLMRR